MARKMKDSGIEWIGEIPEGWEVSQLKYATRWKSEKGCPDAPVLSLYRDFGVVPKDSRDDNHNVTSLDTSNYKVVDIGDLVINKMKAWQGSMAVSDYRGIVSPAYHVCSITSNKVNKRYLHHLLRNPAYLPEYARLSTGMRIGQWDLGFDDFKNIPFLIPPLDEQAKIADYLDNGCASLDAMLSKTRSSIEEYKKLKQAVITQAVTKGVRGEREMKDSGVEWIGEIPKEWVCEKIKYATSISRGLFNHRPRNDERYYNGKYPFIQTGDVANATKYIVSYSQTLNELGKSVSKEFPKGTLTMTIAANVGDVAILNFDAYFPDSVVGFVPNKNIRTLYLFYVFSAMKDEFIRTAIKSTQLNLNIDRVKETFIPVTLNVNEQCEIENYLESKCAEIDGLIAKKEQLVKELESYKKSLIYEVVTGKREV